ncbi:hypothetical protein [Cesiribacter sp. SM1]|uniref:hypothetical protein n=1 Tax=Cesiribacter sp. SM1 TaxID=2861196 RepID=UPI001CD57A68|nr:hypothetical protein [Cesiribacter sp. SM1]
MAEIRVEKKDNKPIWPWIIGALLLIGLIWAVAELFDSEEPEREVAAVEQPVVEDRTVIEEERVANNQMAAPVSEYITFAEQDEQSPDMGLDHEYTSQGIQKLKAALVALADEHGAGNADIQQKKQDMEQAADKIQQDPTSLQHANTIKDTFTKASNLMASIQQNSFPDASDEVEEVKSAAESIDVNTQTLNQKDAVKEFFNESSEAIQAMAGNNATATTGTTNNL